MEHAVIVPLRSDVTAGETGAPVRVPGPLDTGFPGDTSFVIGDLLAGAVATRAGTQAANRAANRAGTQSGNGAGTQAGGWTGDGDGGRTDAGLIDGARAGADPVEGGQTDAYLIAETRAGHLEAFGELYARHVVAARRLAHGLTRNPADVDDLIAEAFTKVLATLRAGRGPELAFRAYLLTAVRNAFHDRVRRDRRISLTDDLTPYDPGEPFVDTTIAALDRSFAARAFAKLPERWRAVLWYTEVEGASPTAVAPLLGLTPNGVAALAYRARERLRQVYLQEHVAGTGDPRCHWTTDRLGGYVRGTLSPRDRLKVDRHLGRCGACRLARGELGDVNAGLHATTPAMLLFWIVSSQPPALSWLLSSQAPDLSWLDIQLPGPYWLLAPVGIAVGRGLLRFVVRCVRHRTASAGTLGPWPAVVTTAHPARQPADGPVRAPG